MTFPIIICPRYRNSVVCFSVSKATFKLKWLYRWPSYLNRKLKSFTKMTKVNLQATFGRIIFLWLLLICSVRTTFEEKKAQYQFFQFHSNALIVLANHFNWMWFWLREIFKYRGLLCEQRSESGSNVLCLKQKIPFSYYPH